MRVIHGIWAHGALCLWAEDPALPPVSSSAGASGAAADVRLLRPHPFACHATELADLLAGRSGIQDPGGQTDLGDAARKAVHDELTLQLPSLGGGPLASPELVRPEALESAPGPGRRGRVSLAGWRVPVLAFGPAAALAVLGAFSEFGGWGQPDDSAAIAGGSLPYLAAVARFAADLAARGRVLPVLADEGETYAARWRPVLGAPTPSEPIAWRPRCPRPAGRPAASSPECCWPVPSTRWPMRPRGPGCPSRCCPRGGAGPRRACPWPNDTCWP